jgi:hypothetical protein
VCACVRRGGEVAILPGIGKCELALSDQCAECCIVVSAQLRDTWPYRLCFVLGNSNSE